MKFKAGQEVKIKKERFISLGHHTKKDLKGIGTITIGDDTTPKVVFPNGITFYLSWEDMESWFEVLPNYQYMFDFMEKAKVKV